MLMRKLNEEHLAQRGGDQALDARIPARWKSPFRMQVAATDAFDIKQGAAPDARTTTAQPFSATLACWRGVWPSVACASRKSTTATASPGTPIAATTKRRGASAGTSIKPMAALLADLKRRGLLDDTLVNVGRRVWPDVDLSSTARKPNSS